MPEEDAPEGAESSPVTPDFGGHPTARNSHFGFSGDKVDKLFVRPPLPSGRKTATVPPPDANRRCGEMAEWSKARHWKCRILQKGIKGSNPFLSAIFF